jgi:hypothetical protein
MMTSTTRSHRRALGKLVSLLAVLLLLGVGLALFHAALAPPVDHADCSLCWSLQQAAAAAIAIVGAALACVIKVGRAVLAAPRPRYTIHCGRSPPLASVSA